MAINPFTVRLPTNQSVANPAAQIPNPYDFTGTDANGTFQGGGQMPVEQQVRTQNTGVQNPRQSVAANWYTPIAQGGGMGDYSPANPWVGEFNYNGQNWFLNDTNPLQNSGLNTTSPVYRGYLPGSAGLTEGYFTIGPDGKPQMMHSDYNPNESWGDDFRAMAPVLGGAALGMGAEYLGLLGGATPNPSLAWASGGAIPGLEAGGVAAGVGGAASAAPWGGSEELFLQNPSLGPGAQAGVGAGSGAVGGIPATGAGAGFEGAIGGAAGGVGDALTTLPPQGNPNIAPPSSSAPGSPGAPGGGPSTLDRLRQILGGGGSNLLPGGGNSNPNSGNGRGSGLGSLAGLIAALNGSGQSSDYARDLKTIANEMRANAQPYMDRLRQSYEDPNAYFNSPDVQARLGLETNRLTGIDSSRGRLSNPIERDMLLQKYAAKDIGDYRSGLNNSIQKMYQPLAVAKLLSNSSLTDNGRFGDIANWFTQNGGGSGGDLRGDIENIIDTGGDLWDFFSDWWD